MPTYTFTNTDADGDLSNVDNWQISGVPAVGLPLSTDSAILDGQTVSMGTCAAHVISASGAVLNGGALNGSVNVSGATFNGATASLSVNIDACTVNVDPGAGITSTGNTQFYAALFSSSITDTGGYFQASATFTALVISSGGTFITGAIFTSTLTATAGTVNGGSFNGTGSQLIGCTITGGSFNSGITFTGGTISGSADFNSTTNFTSVTFDSGFTGTVNTGAACADCTIQAGAFNDATCSGNIHITGGSFTQIIVSTANAIVIGPGVVLGGTAGVLNFNVATPDYPAQANVYTGVIYANGSLTGTLAFAASRIGCSMIQRRA